jgi:hypothetical protein
VGKGEEDGKWPVPGHDFGVGLGVVLRAVGCGECRGCDEVCVVVAEVLDGFGAFVLFW